jgi:hypothetical protein
MSFESEAWLSYAMTSKRLKGGKKEIEKLVGIGALKIRFEGTPKGTAIRYAASDVERIAAEASSGARARSNSKAELRKQAIEWKAAQLRFETERKMRLESDRLSRIVNRSNRENERLTELLLETERQRIIQAAKAASAK